MSGRVWTVDEVRALGVVTDLETAAEIWQIGRTVAYELARDGEFPSPVHKVRGRYVVLVEPMLRALGIEDDAQAPANLRHLRMPEPERAPPGDPAA